MFTAICPVNPSFLFIVFEFVLWSYLGGQDSNQLFLKKKILLTLIVI
jgi:uncharacterized protein YqgC (DUF456 family)